MKKFVITRIVAWLPFALAQTVFSFSFSLFAPSAQATPWYEQYQTIIANDRGYTADEIGPPDVTRPGWFTGKYGTWEQEISIKKGGADALWAAAETKGMRRFCYVGEMELEEVLCFFRTGTLEKPFAIGYLDEVRATTNSLTAQWIGLREWCRNPSWYTDWDNTLPSPEEYNITNFVDNFSAMNAQNGWGMESYMDGFLDCDGNSVDPENAADFFTHIARLDVDGDYNLFEETDPELTDVQAALIGVSNVSHKVMVDGTNQWVVKREVNRSDFNNPAIRDHMMIDTLGLMDYLITNYTGVGQALDGVHIDGLSKAWSAYRPDQNMFGEWSRAAFHSCLTNEFEPFELVQMGVTNSATFDILDYVQQKGIAYADSAWNTNKIWQAYKTCYVKERMALYAPLRPLIKAKAEQHEQETAISANLIPLFDGAALYDDLADILYFEWVPQTAFGLHTYGLPYEGGRLGYIGRLAQKMGTVNYSWVSMAVTEDEQKGLPELHKSMAFSGFANRMMGDWNYKMNHGRESPGTAESFKHITEFIKAAADLGISSRKYLADVGVVFDAWEPLASTTVSKNFVDPFVLEYSGWCDYLEDHQIQWDVLFTKNNLRLSDLLKYKVVILPSFSAMNNNAVQAVKDYVATGGCVIATGLTGDRYAESAYMMPRSSNSFAGFTSDNFQQITNTPGRDYRVNNKDATAEVVMDGLIAATSFDASLVSVSPAINAGITLNTYKDNNDPRLMIDIVNRDYDLTTDSMTETPATEITVKLPYNMTGTTNYVVKFVKSSNTNSYDMFTLPADRVDIDGDELSIRPYQTVHYQMLFIDAQ